MTKTSAKTCRKCGERKPVDRFGKNQHGNPRSICKACEAVDALARYVTKRQETDETYAPRLVETAPEGYRTCRHCGKAYPNTREYFGARNERKGVYGTCKSCLAEKAHKERERLRLEVFSYYSKGGMKCACCGESHLEFLAVDHVHGGGTKHRKELCRTGADLYPWLKRNGFPDGYRVLCFNCNWAEGHGGCPHRLEGAPVVEMKKEGSDASQ